MEEITVDFTNLIYQVCKRWRILLIGMIVGAILADVAGVALNIRRISAKKAEMVEKEVEDNDLVDVTALKAVLNEKEIIEVENAAASYSAYMKTNNAQLTYYCDSILMQMDANEVPTLTLQYYIDNYYKTEYPVVASADNASDIGTALGNYTFSGAVCSKVSETLGWTKEVAYIQDLISFESEDHTLTVKVVAPEEADCKQIGAIIKSQINEAVKKLQDVYGAFEVKLVMEEYVVTASQDLMTAQITQLSNIYSGRNDFRTSVTSFTEAQKVYYDALIENYFKENDTSVSNIVSGDADEQNNTNRDVDLSVSFIHLKYILLGIVAGFFVCAVWICIQHIGSGMLLVKNDMSEGFDISVIGNVKTDDMKKKNIVDRIIERIFRSKGPQFSQEEQLRMSAAAIRIAAEKEGMHKIYISSAANCEKTKQVESALVSLLEHQGVNVLNGASIAYDPESLENMSGCDGTVLVEGVGCSLYKDILTEKQLCEGSHVPIIGAVVVE